ncbi:hypothetical protein NN561_009634 [Cricetulus griseus]
MPRARTAGARAHTVTSAEGRAVSRRRRWWGGVGGSRKCISLGPSGRCGIGAWDRLARAAEKPVSGRSGAIPALRPADRPPNPLSPPWSGTPHPEPSVPPPEFPQSFDLCLALGPTPQSLVRALTAPGQPPIALLFTRVQIGSTRPAEVGGRQQPPQRYSGRPRACMPLEAQGCREGAGGGAREAALCPSSPSGAWLRPCLAPCPSQRCVLLWRSPLGCTSTEAPVPARSWGSRTCWATCTRIC